MNYHGHIYYRDLQKAQQERAALQLQFGTGMKLFPLRKTAIGPHPVPSFGVAFEQSILPDIRRWMKNNIDWMTGLIHPIIANDLQAHTEYAEWIGGKIELELQYLSSPPSKYKTLYLQLASQQPEELDIDHFDIWKEEQRIGHCTMGTHYVSGRSILDSCQLYRFEVDPCWRRDASELVVQYLRNYTDCQTIFLSKVVVSFELLDQVDVLLE